MQNLMELDYGWSTLDDEFIFQVVRILSSSTSLINVCRPATAILKKLVEADPMSAPGLQLASSSRGTASLPAGSVYRYGFSVVFEQMRKGQGFLETVISRLGSADTAMAQYRCVINCFSLSPEAELKQQHDADQLSVGSRKRHSMGRIYFRVGETQCAESCCGEPVHVTYLFSFSPSYTLAATHVIPYNRGFDILYPRLSSERHKGDVSQEDHPRRC